MLLTATFVRSRVASDRADLDDAFGDLGDLLLDKPLHELGAWCG